METTIRLVGSDVGCSLSAIECNWINFTIEKIAGVLVIAVAGSAEIARKWRYRKRALLSATILAIAHLIALRMLFNPS